MSRLERTVVWPGLYKDGLPKGATEVRSTPEQCRFGRVSRVTVAEFLLRCAVRGDHLREAP